jgi:hypothetical protein
MLDAASVFDAGLVRAKDRFYAKCGFGGTVSRSFPTYYEERDGGSIHEDHFISCPSDSVFV